METKIDIIYSPNQSTKLELPFFMVSVSAGFPSPAEDYIESELDLNKFLIKNPAATFFVRVKGDSMIDAGIHSGDILVVDRAIDPTNNKIVIAVIDGELTLKRIQFKKGKLFLVPENDSYDPIEINSEMDLKVWGVVTNVIHAL